MAGYSYRSASIGSSRAPQVQDRQHLGHLRRPARVQRQDRAREALPATLLVHPPVIELQDLTVPSPNGARWASLRSVRRTSHVASRPFAQ